MGGTATERVQGSAFVCLGWVAEATEIYFLTVVEGGSLRSRCRQGWFLLSTWDFSSPARHSHPFLGRQSLNYWTTWEVLL